MKKQVMMVVSLGCLWAIGAGVANGTDQSNDGTDGGHRNPPAEKHENSDPFAYERPYYSEKNGKNNDEEPKIPMPHVEEPKQETKK